MRANWKKAAKRNRQDMDSLLNVACNALNYGGWIDAKTSPNPRYFDWVLVAATFDEDGTYGVPAIAEYRNGEWWVQGYECTMREMHCTVTHWRPLPEHPSKEEQG